MAEFWEAFTRLGYHPLGWNQSTYTDRPIETLSNNVELNPTFREHEQSIRYGRHMEPADVRMLHNVPGGELTVYADPDVWAMLMMSAFQAGTFIGTAFGGTQRIGTYVFSPAENAPNFYGSTWGEVSGNIGTAHSVFPIYMRKAYRAIGSNNAIDFMWGIVDSFRMTIDTTDEVRLAANMKFATAISTTSQGQGETFVDRPILEYYHATISAQIGTHEVSSEITSLNISVENRSADRIYVGTRGPRRFPWEQRRRVTAEFTYELQDTEDLVALEANRDASFSIRVTNGTFTVDVEFAQCRISSSDSPLTGGNPLQHTVQARAVRPSATQSDVTVRLIGTFEAMPGL